MNDLKRLDEFRAMSELKEFIMGKIRFGEVFFSKSVFGIFVNVLVYMKATNTLSQNILLFDMEVECSLYRGKLENHMLYIVDYFLL